MFNRAADERIEVNKIQQKKMTENQLNKLRTITWQLSSAIREMMPMTEVQLQQIVIAFIFLRRIDCLIGKYSKESFSFFIENKDLLSDERLDEKLSEISGGYPFHNHSGYNFNGILLANESLDVVMNSYLQGFSRNVKDILEGMDFNQTLAILQRKSRVLVDILQNFSELELSVSSINNKEFIELIASTSSGVLREFASSVGLSYLISECLFSDDNLNDIEEPISIYDPVCGTGSMLALAGEKAKNIAINKEKVSLFGQELSVFPSAVAKALVLLTGNKYSRVLYGNTLTDDLFRDQYFQYIVADLPLGLKWSTIKDRILMESFAGNRYHIGLPSTSDSQFLFIQHILSKMKASGSRAAFLTTASVLWSGSAGSGESRIRRWLFENDQVETIIALPPGTHSYTAVPLYLWILSNKKRGNQKGHVRLIDLSVKQVKETRLSLDMGFFKSAVALYKANTDSHLTRTVSNDQFGFYEVDLLENDKKETVRISLDTNIEQFVKRERCPYTKSKITIDYGSVEKGYTIKFEDFFKSEKQQTPSLEETTQNMLSLIDEIDALKPFIQQADGFIERVSVPKTWHQLPLRSFVNVVSGSSYTPIPASEGLPVLSVPYLRNPIGNSKAEVSAKARLSTDKDVLIIIKGANSGEVFQGVNGILTPSLAAIRCSDEYLIDHRFLYYLLKGNEKHFAAMSMGSGIKFISTQQILDMKCWIPPIEEQRHISTYLDSVVNRIDGILHNFGGTNNAFAKFRQLLIEYVVQGKYSIK